MSNHTDNEAGRAYARLDNVDLNHIDSRPLHLEVVDVLRRHPAQRVFKYDSLSEKQMPRAGELADNWIRRIERMDTYEAWNYGGTEEGGE